MDDVLINKANIVENCIKRIREEYRNSSELQKNYTKQDSIILNIQRACEASIDMGLHVIRIKRLAVPQSAREVFVILEQNKVISEEISKKMQAMVGFRNIAIHDYRSINLDVVKAIIESHLEDLLSFKQLMLQLI